MGFSIPIQSSGTDKVSTAILNQINVNGVNVKVLPAGTNPNVVYRVGDGTVHPEGWDNVDGEQYLDFYVSTGAKGNVGPAGSVGPKGEQGEQGPIGLTGAVGNDGLSPNYTFGYNTDTGELTYEFSHWSQESDITVSEW